jgi:hypothetical protein
MRAVVLYEYGIGKILLLARDSKRMTSAIEGFDDPRLLILPLLKRSVT